MIQYRVSNTSTSYVQIPSETDQTTIFLTDFQNVNITIPRIIIWNDVLPDEWIIEKASQSTESRSLLKYKHLQEEKRIQKE